MTQRFSTDIYITPYSRLKHKAELGDPQSQFDLAWLYYTANKDSRIQGIPHSFTLAARWYRKAAEQGHSSAQYNLAVMKILGQGVEKNMVEACAWLHLAAQNGHLASKELLPELEQQLDAHQLAESLEIQSGLLRSRGTMAKQP